MTFDHEIKLISITYTENEIGDSIPDETDKAILCGIRSIARSEHYAAAAHGLRPEIVFVVNRHEYEGQRLVEFNLERYTVIRTYMPGKAKDISDFENLELVCQRVVGP